MEDEGGYDFSFETKDGLREVVKERAKDVTGRAL